MWKFALIGAVIVLIAGFALFKFNQNGQNNLNSQTTQNSQVTNQPNQDVPNQPVTTDNAESTLQQTDTAVSQGNDQVDKDLSTLDQTSSQEDDLNNV